MAGRIGRDAVTTSNFDEVAAILDRQWEEAPRLFTPVGLVLMGFVFLAVFTTLAVLLGASFLSSVLLGWVGSLIAILTTAAVAVWREGRALEQHTDIPDPFAQWQADLEAELRHAAQINAWNDDREEDRSTQAAQDKRRA